MTDFDLKMAARQAARARRAAASARLPEAAQTAMRQGIAAIAVPPGTVVSGYWPVGDELDPRPLLAHWQAAGAVVALPVTVGKGMPLLFRQWNITIPPPLGRHNIPAPGPDAATVRPGLLLVPLLAFDRAGSRLGYGGGYYDRSLAALRQDGAPRPRAIGFGYADQLMEDLPTTATDERLDAVLTEQGLELCA